MPATAQMSDIGDALKKILKDIADLQQQVTRPDVMGSSGGGGVAEGDDVLFNSVTIGAAGSTYTFDLTVQAVDSATIVLTPGSYVDNSYIDMSWTNPGASVVEYEVEIAKQTSPGVFALPDVVRTGGTSLRFNNLEPGQTYGFRVYTINRLGIRSAAVPAAYVTAVAVADSGLPPTVTGVTVARGATTVIVKFTPLTAAQAPDVANGRGQYHVQISTDATFATYAQEKYTNDQITAFEDITAQSTWYARVRAIDDSGNAGAWSTVSAGVAAGGVIDSMIIAGLDAAKITVGFLSASRIQANTLTADKLATGSLTSADITIAGGSLRAGNPPATGIMINSQGLSLYGGSVRTVFLDAATGNATFEGTVGGGGLRATPQPAMNLNPSFDANVTNWTVDATYPNTTMVRDTATKYAGAGAVKIGAPTAFGFGWINSDKINVVPGDFYEIRGYMYCPSGYTQSISIEFFAGATSLGRTTIADASWEGVYGAWRPISYNAWGATPILAPPTATQARINVIGYGTVANWTFWVDEMSIGEVPLMFGGVARAPVGEFAKIYSGSDKTNSRFEFFEIAENTTVATSGPEMHFWTQAAANDPTYGYMGRITFFSSGTGPNYKGAMQLIPSHNSTTVSGDGQGIITVYRGNVLTSEYSIILNGATQVMSRLQADQEVKCLRGQNFGAYTNNAFHATNKRTVGSDTFCYVLGGAGGGSGGNLRMGYINSLAMIRWEATNGLDTAYHRFGAAAFDVLSSMDLKKNIQTLPKGERMAKIAKLRPVSFKWRGWPKEDDARQRDSHGLIAEEVAEIFPEAIAGGGIDYAQITTHLIGAVQELEERIAALEAA